MDTLRAASQTTATDSPKTTCDDHQQLLIELKHNQDVLAEINNGIWIFVPNIQAEEEFQGEGCAHSVLPSRIKAVLYRTDDPNDAQSKRKVSDTRWISSPSDESMPQITLQGE